MAFRRRDSGRAAYSYPDAYRTLSNPATQTNTGTLTNPPSAPSSTGHGHTVGSSSDDEGGIVFTTSSNAKAAVSGGESSAPSTPSPQSQVLEPSASTPAAQDNPSRGSRPTRGRETERMSPERDILQSERDESPLSPPRPSFLAGSRSSGAGSSDRASWSSSVNDSVSLEPASDSESGPTPESSTLNLSGNGNGLTAGTGILQAWGSRAKGLPADATGRVVPRPRNHHRRGPTFDDSLSSSNSAGAGSPTASTINPFDTPTSSVYVPSTLGGTNNILAGNARPPPSAFAFPFQSHPGNPDPGMSIPGVARRASFDSFKTRPKSSGSISNAPPTSIYQVASGYQSHGDLAGESLGRPNAPFMAGGEGRDGSPVPPSPNLSQSNIYRNSVAGALTGGKPSQLPPFLSSIDENHHSTSPPFNSDYFSHTTYTSGITESYSLPRTNSVPTITMRAPFLSPASRPSSIWSPPAYPYPPGFSPSLPYLPSSSSPAPPYTKKSKSLMPSTRLESKLTKEDKPWLNQKDKRTRWSWWLTVLCFFIGIGAAGIVVYLGWSGVKFLKDGDMCMVLNEGFDSLDLDNTWTRDVELGGFGCVHMFKLSFYSYPCSLVCIL